jgi:hypothetical protein
VIGVNIAADRRRLFRSVDGQARTLRNPYASAHGHVGHGAGSASGHDDITVDNSVQRTDACGISGVSQRRAPNERSRNNGHSKRDSSHSFLFIERHDSPRVLRSQQV